MDSSKKKYVWFGLALFCLTPFAFRGTGYCEEAKPLLTPAPQLDKSPAYKAILKKEPGTPSYEIAKIEYLMERISRTSVAFIRNKKKHKGPDAALHMKWKYARYQKEVKTAEDFVRKIADGSRKTGQPYKIKLPDGKIYRGSEVLLAELEFLEKALGQVPASEKNEKSN